VKDEPVGTGPKLESFSLLCVNPEHDRRHVPVWGVWPTPKASDVVREA
jgi:hypothetical protein